MLFWTRGKNITIPIHTKDTMNTKNSQWNPLGTRLPCFLPSPTVQFHLNPTIISGTFLYRTTRPLSLSDILLSTLLFHCCFSAPLPRQQSRCISGLLELGCWVTVFWRCGKRLYLEKPRKEDVKLEFTLREAAEENAFMFPRASQAPIVSSVGVHVAYYTHKAHAYILPVYSRVLLCILVQNYVSTEDGTLSKS